MDREELANLFEQFVSEEYPSREIEMYADYRDELSEDQACGIITYQYPMEAFYETIDDGYMGASWEYESEIESEFERWCSDHGYEYESGDLNLNDIQVNEYIDIYPDYDHYLKQEFNCRLIVDNGDANYEFTRNPNQDNEYQILSGAGIIWLGDQLGYTVEQMQAALDQLGADENGIVDNFENPDKFLDSLVHEAANAYWCPMLTFLCKMTLEDLIKFKENPSAVTVGLNGSNCGFFDGYNGGGSVLELELGRDSITIPADKIFSLVPDAKCDGMYSVDEVYGLSGWVYAEATVQ